MSLSSVVIKTALVALSAFLAVCLLTSVPKVFADDSWRNKCMPLSGHNPCLGSLYPIAGEGRGAPFQLFDFVNNNWVYRDPGSIDGSEVGMFNSYCVRAVLRQETNLINTPIKENVLAQFCVGKSSNETEIDPVSGSVTFPQAILQISRCEETGPLGHASANPACGEYHDVDLIGRAVTGSGFYPE